MKDDFIGISTIAAVLIWSLAFVYFSNILIPHHRIWQFLLGSSLVALVILCLFGIVALFIKYKRYYASNVGITSKSTKLTVQEIEKMPGDVYKKRLMTERGFAKAVDDAYEAECAWLYTFTNIPGNLKDFEEQ